MSFVSYQSRYNGRIQRMFWQCVIAAVYSNPNIAQLQSDIAGGSAAVNNSTVCCRYSLHCACTLTRACLGNVIKLAQVAYNAFDATVARVSNVKDCDLAFASGEKLVYKVLAKET